LGLGSKQAAAHRSLRRMLCLPRLPRPRCQGSVGVTKPWLRAFNAVGSYGEAKVAAECAVQISPYDLNALLALARGQYTINIAAREGGAPLKTRL
jgi:hypothetical protein